MKSQHPHEGQASSCHPLPQPYSAVWRSWVKSSVNEVGVIMKVLMTAKMLVPRLGRNNFIKCIT